MLPKMEGGELPLPTFNSMLEDDDHNDWYLNNPSLTSLLSSTSTFDLYDPSLPFLPPTNFPISTADDPFLLQPLEASPPAGAEPTLFQKRAAGRKEEAAHVKEEGDVDGNAGGKKKGKGMGMPAKNLMAERRRRQKLNDRLFMLRSVVPKISKMDRASILGDAIDYMKELRQKINDLNNELGSTPSTSSLPLSNPASFQPLTPTLPTLPSCMIDELSPSSLPSASTQSAEVEVTVTDDQAVNIHMVCPRRPSVLLSSMGALDGLGLDIQQAVVSCFSGFRLDVFRAEQCRAGPGAGPEEIRAALLQAAGFHGI